MIGDEKHFSNGIAAGASRRRFEYFKPQTGIEHMETLILERTPVLLCEIPFDMHPKYLRITVKIHIMSI